MHASKLLTLCLSTLFTLTTAAPTPSNDLTLRNATATTPGTIPSSVPSALKVIRLNANTAITTLIVTEIALIDDALGTLAPTYLIPLSKIVNTTLASVTSTVTKAENTIHDELVGVVVNATGPIPAAVVTDVKAVLAATQSSMQGLLNLELANVNSVLGGAGGLVMAVDGVVAATF